MPYSSGGYDAEVGDFIRLAQPRAVLDIGAGAGKYGAIVKQASPGTHVTALEPDSDYVERFGLGDIYDTVLVADAEALMQDVDAEFDVVILGDVIEHLRKSAGIDLLNFLVYRARTILVIFPLRHRQGSYEGHVQEAHVSVWRESDFIWCDHSYQEHGGLALVKITGFVD